MNDPRIREAMERISESTMRAIKAELRRQMRRASRSPSRITVEPKEHQ